MTLRRHVDFIEIEDKNELGTACELTRFPFYAFVHAMLGAAKDLVLLAEEIHENVESLLAEINRAKDPLKAICLERLAEHFSDNWVESVAEIENLLDAQSQQ